MIIAYELYRLTVPLGRMIGDNSCSYDELDVLAIGLKTQDGLIGWGYSESMSKGTFRKPAWWIRPLPNEQELRMIFEADWLPFLKNKYPFELRNTRLYKVTDHKYIDAAVRLALWDLMAQEAKLPLYRFLGGSQENNKARAYGSILDFPLTDDETVALTKKFLNKGFDIIKMKLGNDCKEDDLKRLQLVQQTIGRDKTITADVNQCWDWQTTLSRLEYFDKNGVQLEYLEDPLPKDDIEGLRELTKRSPIPIIGHDYTSNIPELRRMIDVGGLNGLRSGKDMDFLIACSQLALEFDIPVYLVNSLFEVNVHAAVALPAVKRMEFADLGWNDLMKNPIQFENGYAIAPDTHGHGLAPDSEKINLYRNCNGVST
jgi:L-alanine-DL-glutamate epimerase-like enolase superfamily enzyme